MRRVEWCVAVELAVVLTAAWAAAGEARRIVEAEGLDAPRMSGRWVVYHVGRKGQRVYDLESGEVAAEINQYRPLPYDVNSRFVLSVSGAGTRYLYDLSEGRRQTGPMRRIDDLEAIRVGQGGWFVGVVERYSRELRRKRRQLRFYRLNGRPIGGPLTPDLLENRYDVAGDAVVWLDRRVGEAGVYAAEVRERRPRQLSEAIVDDGPWTDGKRAVWVNEGKVTVCALESGEKRVAIEPAEDGGARPVQAKVLGEVLVVVYDDWSIVAHPLDGGEGRVVVDAAEAAGLKTLVGVGAGRVVWRTADTLWAAPLEPGD